MVDVDVEFPHKEKEMRIHFHSKLDEAADNESWGIKDFQIYIPALDKAVASPAE